jgi:hypothetical protein
MKIKSKFCPALWFSGFFATAALVHIVRFFAGWDLRVGGLEVPLVASGVAGTVLLLVSLGFLAAGIGRPCERKAGSKTSGSCCFR